MDSFTDDKTKTYHKSYYEKNKERIKQYHRDNKAERNEASRKYYEKNKESLKAKARDRARRKAEQIPPEQRRGRGRPRVNFTVADLVSPGKLE